jgi:hypothetical protein
MLRGGGGYVPGGEEEQQLVQARNAELDAAARAGEAIAAAAGGAAGAASLMSEVGLYTLKPVQVEVSLPKLQSAWFPTLETEM